MTASIAIAVTEPTEVAAARRVAVSMATSLGFDATTSGKLSLVVTEAGTNILKHGGGGEILLGAVERGEARAAEMIALDRGRGMSDVARSRRDGHSTSGSPGTGLGAMARLASTFDVYSRPGAGTAVLAQVTGPDWPPAQPVDVCVGGLSVAMPREDVCGDEWAEERGPGYVALMIADGLGHGPLAAEAARECVAAFHAARGLDPAERVGIIHEAARATRGAAVAVARIDLGRRVVTYAGLGNVSAAVHSPDGTRHLLSQNGTAGQGHRRIDENAYPWPLHATLVMYSDGLQSRVALGAYPGLLGRHPTLIAGILYRDMSRRRDDVTVVVAGSGGA